jgi:hypothetical protein
MYRLLPLVQKTAPSIPLSLGVFEGLSRLTAAQRAQASVSIERLEQFARHITDTLDVSKLSCGPSPVHQGQTCRCCDRCNRKPVGPGPVNDSGLAPFVSSLLAEGASDIILARFALKVVGDVGIIKMRDFHGFWLPFLRQLLEILEEHAVPLSTPLYRHLFAAVLETFLAKRVGPPSMRWLPEIWTVPCLCRICSLINGFLSSDAPAASVNGCSGEELLHIGTFVWPYRTQLQCAFSPGEGGGIVITKVIKGPSFQKWEEERSSAAVEIGKLFGPALRTVLGGECDTVMNFNPTEPPVIPVPIENFAKGREQPQFPTAYAMASGPIPAIHPNPPGATFPSQLGPLGSAAGSHPSASGNGCRLPPLQSILPPESVAGGLGQVRNSERPTPDARTAGWQSPATATPPGGPAYAPQKNPAPAPLLPSIAKGPPAAGNKRIMSSTWRGPTLRASATPAAPAAAPYTSPYGRVLSPMSQSTINKRSSTGGNASKPKLDIPPQRNSSRPAKKECGGNH